MPPVVALVALAVVFGLAWRRIRRETARDDTETAVSRGPTEIFDAVPLVRGEDGVYRPDRPRA
ncbi:MAG: hypothetical protein GX458_10335 [Phyllobacteriaceae bacterium]|nr:hypothetical protein [Phyllobacteriaceae bacterium]